MNYKLLSVTTILLFFSQPYLSSLAQSNKPNVLFIAVDDLRSELGYFENSSIITPNLDKLASQGVSFTNHFVQVPTCGASRAAFLTGKDLAELLSWAIISCKMNSP